MSSSNQVNINPTFVDSLGSTTDFKKVIDLLGPDYKSPITSSSFTNFINSLRSVLPGSASVPVQVIAKYQTYGSQGQVTGQVTIPVTLTQNFDINAVFASFLAQYNSSGFRFSSLTNFAYEFDAYLHRYYSSYAMQLPELANAIRNATLQARLQAQQQSHVSVTPSIQIDFFRDPGVVTDVLRNGIKGDLQVDATSAGTIGSILPAAGTDKVADPWFSNFLKNFEYPPGGAPVTLTYFLNKMAESAKQFTVTAVLTGSAQIPDALEDHLLRYIAVYNALFPNADSNAQVKGYNDAITDFYRKEVKKYGPYVTPSQAFADWVTYTKNKYLSSALPSDFTSLSSINAKKTLIISDIYALIASMVDSIQKIAAAQATRLLLLTEWQRAYSQQLTQVPTFLGAEYPWLDSGNRADLNAKINQTLITNMQTQQSLVSDDAKALQSNINQSNDAVSQQANMAQSLLQELNTILAAIFK